VLKEVRTRQNGREVTILVLSSRLSVLACEEAKTTTPSHSPYGQTGRQQHESVTDETSTPQAGQLQRYFLPFCVDTWRAGVSAAVLQEAKRNEVVTPSELGDVLYLFC
jgi:hypothetical protein